MKTKLQSMKTKFRGFQDAFAWYAKPTAWTWCKVGTLTKHLQAINHEEDCNQERAQLGRFKNGHGHSFLLLIETSQNKVVLLKKKWAQQVHIITFDPLLCPCSTYILLIFYSLNKLYIIAPYCSRIVRIQTGSCFPEWGILLWKIEHRGV